MLSRNGHHDTGPVGLRLLRAARATRHDRHQPRAGIGAARLPPQSQRRPQRGQLLLPAVQDRQRLDGRAGWGAALSAFACQLTPELATDQPLPARVLTDQLGALLALGFGSEIPATPAEARDAARLLDQIGRAIRLRYAEPGLTAVAVAVDLRVSERTLHRCLNKAGLTFSGLLNDCRMAAARGMLSEL